MKVLVTALFLMASILCTRPADARPGPTGIPGLPRALGGTITVPAEWAGVWSLVDSTYNCTGVFQNTSISEDTLCTGQTFETDPNYICTGSATPTTFQQTCTGTTNVFPDCDVQFVLDTRGTRSGDSYFTVSTITITYVGTGKGCDVFPASCTQYNSHGTRTGSAPPAYCASPVQSATWGELKAHYR